MDQFKQLSTFVDVAGKGSLSAAARAEGVAPAMISRRLDALEARLGVKQLVTVLDEYSAPDNASYAVFAQRQHLPLRIRAFVEFLRRAYARPDYWRHSTL